MIIGIDARLAAKGRGLGEFADQLIHHLPTDNNLHYVIFTTAQAAWRGDRLSATMDIVTVPSSYAISEQVALPWLLRKHRIDVFHATTNTAPLLLPAATKLILTIHDAMFLSDRQRIPTATSWYQRLGRRYYAAISQRLVNRADRITTISQFSKGDVAEGFGLDPSSITVIYEGVGEEFYQRADWQTVLTELNMTAPYFLHLGAIDPRKQTRMVLEAFADWQRKNPDRVHQLVITGVKPSHQAPFRQMAETLGIADRVQQVGFVSKDALVRLMSGAEALLFPSLYEGFGLPMLQAMACGCPVITSRASSLPEIGSDAAMYIEPQNHRQLTNLMGQVTADLALRQKLVQLGQQRAAMFKWSSTAAAYAKLYQEVATA